MKAPFRSISLALFIGLTLLLSATHAQTPSPTPATDTVTEKEKLEIRSFTQDFMAKLRKTRDVRPFLTRYFADDFEAFTYFYLSADPGTKKTPSLSRLERKRFVIAFLNFLYAMAPYTVTGHSDFEKRLPASLRRRYAAIEKLMENDEFLKARPSFLRFIPKVETFTDKMRRQASRKRIESSEVYRANVRKRQALDDYDFKIIEDSPDPNEDNPAARWIRRRGSDVRTFTVGTPYGIAVVLIRVKGQCKVLFVWPWPISYDSRLH